MTRKLTANSSLDALKKEAKRWLKAIRAGDAEALTRLHRVLPRANATVGLREIQQALAREYGIASWAALKQELADAEIARCTHSERLDEFLEHAILNYGIPPGDPKWDPSYPDDPSRREYAARILTKHPELLRDSLHAAVLCGDIAEVERLLERDRSMASRRGGRRGWEPLLYVAYGRVPLAAATEQSVAIAQRLLDHGADPNVRMTDGTSPFTAITGFIGEGERTPVQVPPHPRAEELVRLLIERGANPFDMQALYNTSLWHDSTKWLDILYECDESAGRTARWNEARDGQLGQLDYLLGNAVVRNHLRRAEWLLARGASARAPHAYTRRNLHTTAVLHGHTRMAELLARANATIETLEGYEAFQTACLRLDADGARQLAGNHPEYLEKPAALLTAARAGRVDVVELLLDLGTSPNVEDANGERGLHSATWSDAVPVAQLLVARGADVDARDRKYHATPLSWSLHLGKPQLVDYLSTVSRDVLCLAYAGKLERLRTLLHEEPALARTQQFDMTMLFAYPEHDEDLAIEIAQLFLSHGADPSYRNRKGFTAADEAERSGMDALTDVLRCCASDTPRTSK